MLSAPAAGNLTVMDPTSYRARDVTDGPSARRYDPISQGWLAELRDVGVVRDAAIGRLHALLLRAARFEVARRRRLLPHVRGGDLDDIANMAADDALVAVLDRLEDFRGESRFTTWADKFALFEAAVKLRRRSWQGREVPFPWAGDLELLPGTGPSPHDALEQSELITAVRDAIHGVLTPHQHEVFTALALNGVPIDVLAERLGTTRGALYKTLHDARSKLRRELARGGFPLNDAEAAR